MLFLKNRAKLLNSKDVAKSLREFLTLSMILCK